MWCGDIAINWDPKITLLSQLSGWISY